MIRNSQAIISTKEKIYRGQQEISDYLITLGFSQVVENNWLLKDSGQQEASNFFQKQVEILKKQQKKYEKSNKKIHKGLFFSR